MEKDIAEKIGDCCSAVTIKEHPKRIRW